MCLPFTPDRRVRFLHHLATTGNVRRACAAVGVSPQAAYVHKRRDAAFAHGWDAALLLARDAAEEVLAERALHGTQETIFYRGDAVGSRVRFDARLLLAHIARLDRHHEAALAEAAPAGGIAARFDEYLAELREAGDTGHEPAFAPPDDDFEAPPQWTPAQPTRAEVLLAARENALYAFPPRVEDLPAETLAAFDLDKTDVHEIWPRALAQSQRKAEAAAAKAWDSAAETRLAALDALFSEEEEGPPHCGKAQMASAPLDPPHFSKAQMASAPLDPPHCGEAQMGRWQPEGLTEGEVPPLENPQEPPIETKSAKPSLDRVNRVNLGAPGAADRARLFRSSRKCHIGITMPGAPKAPSPAPGSGPIP